MTLFSNVTFSLLLAGVLSACAPAELTYEISFSARYGGEPLRCTDDASGPRLRDLRFFVHDVMLIQAEGKPVPLRIVADGQWQGEEVALIDLEDGTGACQNGTAETNATLFLRGPATDYSAIRFTVGVPETANHADPLQAQPPLTDSAMHWHWRSGYKFLRAGMSDNDAAVRLHLGSARCRGVIGNLQGCDASNRPRITLQDFDPLTDTVHFDFAVMLQNLALTDAQLQVCEMGPDDAICRALIGPLGLDSGGNVVSPAQVFRTGS